MKKNRISQQAKPANQGVGFGIRKQIQPSAAFHEYENITGDANPKIKKIDEVDPLDEYMSVIETQLQNEQKEVQGNPNNTEKAKQKGVEEGEDEEEEDMVDTYIRAMDEKGYKFGTYKEDASEIKTWIQDKEVLEVPEEIQQFSNKNIEPMKKVDHSKIQYRNIKKFEYSEHNEVKSFELRNIRKELGISVSENDKTKPCLKFEHFGFPENLNKIIEKYDFKDPTDIQKQVRYYIRVK
ncbi:DEAD-box ATP-dependent RNA helicase 24 [Zancudomyces culisetae]|uniref:DEAD-box ATP-dependent RNA helicase 24 n=1 Tax=Zancudomyces culisetae TaxID=1213189 RepID=A0A1R1PXW9_ZANCU|nr:DEAD-box ATP-dependent RNA helicase 24 [Zancudomyces culisetae]|eukprot:OMH85810.1 DEAD-box ATP-dependent RNA helicase 24 [Zancudomyces culisetae]